MFWHRFDRRSLAIAGADSAGVFWKWEAQPQQFDLLAHRAY